MYKTSRAKAHLSNEELTSKIKTTAGFWRVQKWLIIYNAMNYPRKAKEIANHLAVSESSVHKTISSYSRMGEKAIDTIGKGGRKNAYLTLDEERTFMDSYLQRAQQGQIATAMEIKADFEKKVGESVSKTTIYRLLERHGWRKIVPLPFHPRKDKDAQEAFKKTSGMT